MTNIIHTSFSKEQLSILIPSLVFIFLSILFYAQKRQNLAITFLMIGALGIRLFMIVLDPFLNEWDERYHALVAKNMIHHLFVPTLWPEPILSYDYKEWCCNYYWVHKQPLFMWQMAISMKIFGVNEIAMRLPSALMNTLQVFLTYRIATLLHDKRMGYLAAFLFTFGYYGLEQVSGSMGREHNDVAFLFYLTASFWALAEYLKKPKLIFVMLIGLFSGAAILNKWLVGLLVYAGWFLGLIIYKKDYLFNIKNMAISLIVTVLTFLPWQIYIFNRFPLESQHELTYNGKHITEVLDGHGGDFWYYFKNNYILYGAWSWIFILLGVSLFIFKIKNSILKHAILLSTIILYLFFTFVKTKFVSFVYVASFIYIFMSIILYVLEDVSINHLPKGIAKLSTVIFIILAGVYTFHHWKIESYHTRNKPNYFAYGPERINRIHDAAILKKLKNEIDPSYLIFNTTQPIEVMFYTNNIAYFWLGPEDYHKLKEKGYKMAAMVNKDHPIPYYLEQDSTVLILDLGLKN